jgi:hypothetical protein
LSDIFFAQSVIGFRIRQLGEQTELPIKPLTEQNNFHLEKHTQGRSNYIRIDRSDQSNNRSEPLGSILPFAEAIPADIGSKPHIVESGGGAAGLFNRDFHGAIFHVNPPAF